MREESNVEYLLYSLILRELPALPFSGQQGQFVKYLEIFSDVLQVLDMAQLRSDDPETIHTSSFNVFSSSLSDFPAFDAVHGSRCSLFNSGAPRLTSRFKLQYLQTIRTNSSFLRTLILLM